MSTDDLLSVCVLMLSAVVARLLWVHLREIERDKQRVVRRQTNLLTLRAGEAIVGVMERGTGSSIFRSNRTKVRKVS